MARPPTAIRPRLHHVAIWLAVSLAALLIPQPVSPVVTHLPVNGVEVAALDGRLPDGAPDIAAATATPTTTSTDTLLAMAIVPAALTEGTTSVTLAETVSQPQVVVSTPAVATSVPATSAAMVSNVETLSSPEPTVRAAVAAALPPSRFATRSDIETALAQTPWPVDLWPQLIDIAMCESGVDTNHDGYYDVVDTQARGAGGRYIGVLQIGADHYFAAGYDLATLVGNLNAGYELWAGAGRSFSPWSCR